MQHCPAGGDGRTDEEKPSQFSSRPPCCAKLFSRAVPQSKAISRPLDPIQARASPQTVWKWGIVTLYGLVVFSMIPFHEPWRDEAHTWLIARDLSYGGIVQQMHYEGYPPLWFLL